MSLNNRTFVQDLQEALLSPDEKAAAASASSVVGVNELYADLEELQVDVTKGDHLATSTDAPSTPKDAAENSPSVAYSASGTLEQINGVQLALGTAYRITDSVAQGLLFFGPANEKVVIGISMAAIPLIDFLNHRVLHVATHHATAAYPDMKETFALTLTAAGIGGAAQIADVLVAHSSWLPEETPEVAGALTLGATSFLATSAVLSGLNKRVFPAPHDVSDHAPATNKQHAAKLAIKYIKALGWSEMILLATGINHPMVIVGAEVLRKTASYLLFVPRPFERIRETDALDELKAREADIANVSDSEDDLELITSGLRQRPSRMQKVQEKAQEASRVISLTASGVVKKTRAVTILATVGLGYLMTEVMCTYATPSVCAAEKQATLAQRAARGAGMLALYLGGEKLMRKAIESGTSFYNQRRTKQELAAKQEQVLRQMRKEVDETPGFESLSPTSKV